MKRQLQQAVIKVLSSVLSPFLTEYLIAPYPPFHLKKAPYSLSSACVTSLLLCLGALLSQTGATNISTARGQQPVRQARPAPRAAGAGAGGERGWQGRLDGGWGGGGRLCRAGSSPELGDTPSPRVSAVESLPSVHFRDFQRDVRIYGERG